MTSGFLRSGIIAASVTLPTAAMLITTLLLLIAEAPQLASAALLHDDGWWVGMPMVGSAQQVQHYEAYHKAIYWVSQFQSVFFLRFLILSAHGVAAGLFAYLLRSQGATNFGALLTTIGIFTLPLFPAQHLFVSASHQIVALPVLLAGLTCLCAGARRDGTAKVAFYIAGVIVCLAATRISPIMALAPLCVLIVWLVLDRTFAASAFNRALAGLLVALIVVDMGHRLVWTPHVYGVLKGWTNFSPLQPFANLEAAVSGFLTTIRAAGPVAQALYASSVVAFLLSVAPGKSAADSAKTLAGTGTRKKQLRASAIVLTCVAALMFAPAAFLSFYVDRYSLVPGFLTLGALGGFLLAFERSSRSWVCLSCCCCFLTAANIVCIYEAQARRMEPPDRTTARLFEALRNDAREWKPNPQVVVFLDPSDHDEYLGYVHFSSGVLRYLVRRRDLVGLIGRAQHARSDPIVDKPNDFGSGDQYWRMQNGRYLRLKMVGLHPNRPLYVYSSDGDGADYRMAHVASIPNRGKILVVPAGSEPSRALVLVTDGASPCLAKGETHLIWPSLRSRLAKCP